MISDTIDELKSEHKTVATAISDISERLEKVENQTANIDHWQSEVSELRETMQNIVKISSDLRVRLDDAEDRSRRDNLVFYGIQDDTSENAPKSETKALKIINNTLNLDVASGNVARAHRIGRFWAGKNRLMIVMFTAYETKAQILRKRF